MKKGFKVLIISIFLLIVILVASVLIFEYQNKKEEAKSHYCLSQKEMAMLHDGDIILRKGYGSISESIAKYLKEPYNISHCAVIAIDSISGEISVYHSVSNMASDFDGMQKASINEFCKASKKNTIIVVRFKKNDEKPLSLISKKAIEFYNRKIPFDNSFSLESTDEYYCSEVIWRILLEEYNFDLYPVRTGDAHLRFTPFYDTTNFTIVMNHQNKSTQIK